jgi:hypothetical protein
MSSSVGHSVENTSGQWAVVPDCYVNFNTSGLPPFFLVVIVFNHPATGNSGIRLSGADNQLLSASVATGTPKAYLLSVLNPSASSTGPFGDSTPVFYTRYVEGLTQTTLCSAAALSNPAVYQVEYLQSAAGTSTLQIFVDRAAAA